MGFHIVKRDTCPLWKKACFYVLAVLAALVVGGILLFAMGVNPIAYYSRMFTMGMVGNKIAYKVYINYLKEFVPLALTSVALSLAFKMKFWNIGGEGQFILGAIAASAVAISLGDTLPSVVVLVLMSLAAMVVAGLYGLVVAALKVRFGTNETLLTLMFNYLAIYLLKFLMETKTSWNFLLNPDELRPVPQNFPGSALFPSIPMGGRFQLNICVIFIVVSFFCTFLSLYQI